MKLGIVVDSSVKGGVLEMVQALLVNLPANVRQVLVLDISEAPTIQHFTVPEHTRCEVIWVKGSSSGLKLGAFPSRVLQFAFEYPWLSLIRARRFKRLLQSLQLDYLICANGGMPGSRETLAILRAATSSNIKSSLWIHSMFSQRSFLLWRGSQAYIARLLESCYRVVVPSNAVANSIPTWATKHDRVTVAPNFLHQEISLHEYESNGVLRIACPAAYFPNKGQTVLLLAAESLARMGLDFRISFYGDGDDGYRQKLQRLALKLGISDSVDFYGYRTKTDVYSAAQLVVLPSISQEAFGLTVLESMSLGIPVVASDVGGIPELFEPGESIALVEAGNSAAFADRIASFLRNETSIAEEGKRMRSNYLARHQPSNAACNLLSALDLKDAHSE